MNGASAGFFEFSVQHVTLTALGAVLLLAYWLPRLLFRWLPPSHALLMIFGLLVYVLVPEVPRALQPTTSPVIWERTSEFVVIVVLFATGLRIDKVGGWRRWMPAVRLLAIAMPLTIAAVAVLGWSLAGMTLAGAVLLGAALAPTDPVLAGDLQVGPPLEGGEQPIRFSLTTEAGLNDGLAFPFVYLGLLIAAQGGDPTSWFYEWILRDVLYRVVVGAIVGAGTGWLLGKVMFGIPAHNVLADTGPGVVALAGVLLCYGAVELAEGYGFIGVFVAGVVCRRVEEKHEFHRRLHSFSEAIEHAVTAILLVWLGSVLPALWPYLDLRHVAVGLALLLVIRPAVGWLSLVGSGLRPRQRAIVAFFGIRGIGSVYYLAYASGQIEFINENQLWALVAFCILASTLLHGAALRAVRIYGPDSLGLRPKRSR